MSESIESSDFAAPEVANEDGVAEGAEIPRCPNDSPRCIQPGTGLEMADVPAIGLVHFDEPKTCACHAIVPGGVLLGVSDEERSANVLDIIRRKVARNSVIIEQFFGDIYALESTVIDFDSSGAEVRYV